jgi:hypothetical protein
MWPWSFVSDTRPGFTIPLRVLRFLTNAMAITAPSRRKWPKCAVELPIWAVESRAYAKILCSPVLPNLFGSGMICCFTVQTFFLTQRNVTLRGKARLRYIYGTRVVVHKYPFVLGGPISVTETTQKAIVTKEPP